MKILRLIIVASAFVFISACHKDKNLPEPQTEKPSGVIPQAQLDALNKAKNVENVMMQDAQRQREQMEQQSQ